MENTDSQKLMMEYQMKFYLKVQTWVDKRLNSDLSQAHMAQKTGRSLSTIKRFESYGCLDAYLLFAYQVIL